MSGISGAITQQLWHDMIGVLLNSFALQNIPVNELKGQVGILFFILTLLSAGIVIGRYTNKRKEKTHNLETMQSEQIGCPKCSHPNRVYPPTKDYTRVVYSECKDKGALVDNHNRKYECKCSGCGKKFDFYWCLGHPFIGTIG